MSRTFDVPRTPHQITVYKSALAAFGLVFAVFRLQVGQLHSGVAMIAVAIWLGVETTWSYDGHALLALVLAGCALHAIVYNVVIGPVAYGIAAVAVALYLRYGR